MVFAIGIPSAKGLILPVPTKKIPLQIYASMRRLHAKRSAIFNRGPLYEFHYVPCTLIFLIDNALPHCSTHPLLRAFHYAFAPCSLALVRGERGHSARSETASGENRELASFRSCCQACVLRLHSLFIRRAAPTTTAVAAIAIAGREGVALMKGVY